MTRLNSQSIGTALPALDGSSKEPAYVRNIIAAFPDVCLTPPHPTEYTATDDLWL